MTSAYVDASALAKLALDELESEALEAHVRGATLMTSEIALTEVTRACKIALGPDEGARRAAEALRPVVLLSVDSATVRRAAELASQRLRTLDAIHLATALAVEPDELVAYDRRLLDAAVEAGLTTATPGA